MKSKITTLDKRKTFTDKQANLNGILPVVGEVSFSDSQAGKQRKRNRIKHR